MHEVIDLLLEPGASTTTIIGLDEDDRVLPARQFLEAIRWDGPPVDPDTLSASDFLGLL